MAQQFDIGPIVGMFLKPRYATINSFVWDITEFETSFTGLDIFIDLNTMVTKLSTAPKFLNMLPYAQDGTIERALIVNILSVVKHWKDYSRKAEGSRVFLIVNDLDMKPNIPERKVLNNYLKSYTNQFTNDNAGPLATFAYYWNSALSIVEKILQYVPGIYLLKCDLFDAYVAPKIFSTPERYKIIISESQLFSMYALEPRTKFILTQFKSQLSDPAMIVKSITKIDADIMDTFVKNKVFFAMLHAILGNRDRGLIGTGGVSMSAFATNLMRAYERNDITQDPKSIESVLSVVDNEHIRKYLTTTFPLIDLDKHAAMIPQSSIEKIKATMIDMYDVDGLSTLSKGLDFDLISLL